jgi:hypothetical protein
MPKLITNDFDKMIEKRLVKMPQVERIWSLVDRKGGSLFMRYDREVEIIANKHGSPIARDRTKEESSTSEQAEEILGETIDRLGGYGDRAPRGDYGDHMNDVFAREPTMPR